MDSISAQQVIAAIALLLMINTLAFGLAWYRNDERKNQYHAHFDDSKLLVYREEFETPLGTGVREVYKDGKYTLEVTSKPTEESLLLEKRGL